MAGLENLRLTFVDFQIEHLEQSNNQINNSTGVLFKEVKRFQESIRVKLNELKSFVSEYKSPDLVAEKKIDNMNLEIEDLKQITAIKMNEISISMSQLVKNETYLKHLKELKASLIK